MLVLRRTEPDRERPFRTPAVSFVAPAGIVVSIVLMAQLTLLTWARFLIWMALGLARYFGWSRRRANVALMAPRPAGSAPAPPP